MTDDVKEMLELQLSLLKKHMKENGLIFGIGVNKTDVNNSKLYFLDKEALLNRGVKEGISIKLTDLNEGL
jgi:hypothetical protein